MSVRRLPGPALSVDGPPAADLGFDDLALLLLYLASREETHAPGRCARKTVPFETLDGLAEPNVPRAGPLPDPETGSELRVTSGRWSRRSGGGSACRPGSHCRRSTESCRA